MVLFTQDPEQLNIYGHKFRWKASHTSPEELRRLIFSYDTVAAEALDALDETVPPVTVTPQKSVEGIAEETDKKKYRDLYKLVQEHAATDERIGKLWEEVNTVPEWVDWEQIERGQKIFWRYGGAAITAVCYGLTCKLPLLTKHS